MTEPSEEPVAPSVSNSTARGAQEFSPQTIVQHERYINQNIKTDDAASRRHLQEIGFKVCLGLFVLSMLVSFALGVGASGDLQSWMQGIFAGTVGAAAGYATGSRTK